MPFTPPPKLHVCTPAMSNRLLNDDLKVRCLGITSLGGIKIVKTQVT